MRIQRGQFSSLLRRYLGMTGATEVISELAPELSASFTLEQERAEWEFIKSAKLMSCIVAITGVAAQTTGFKLTNPVNSGVVAVFGPPFGPALDIGIATTAQSSSVLSFFTQGIAGALATSVAPIPRDTRIGPIAAGTSAILGSQTNNLGGTNLGFNWGNLLMITSQPYKFDFSFVLTPGNELSIASTSPQTQFSGMFHWLEKRLDDLEKTS